MKVLSKEQIIREVCSKFFEKGYKYENLENNLQKLLHDYQTCYPYWFPYKHVKIYFNNDLPIIINCK